MKISRIRGLAAGLVLLVCGAATAGVNGWTVTGPQGGNFGEFERAPTAPNTLYAGLGHSFFRSTNSGRTWNSGYHFEEQVTDIAVDHTDARRVYVTTVAVTGVVAGVYRTEDGGDTFTKVANPFFGAWGVGVGGPDGRTIYYSSSNQFARSTDRGVTWTVRSTPVNVVTKLVVDRANPDRIFGKIGNWLGRSFDGGATWVETFPTDFWSIDSIVRVSDSVWLIGYPLGIIRSTDDGQTWTSVSTTGPWSMAVDAANPNRFVALINQYFPPQISTDGGLTWKLAGLPPRLAIARGVAVNGNTFTAIGDDGVQVSTNAGAAWSLSTRGPVATGAQNLFAASHHGSPVYAQTTGLNLWTSDAGGPWNLVPGFMQGQTTLVANPDDARILYGSAFNAGVARSTDGGNSWSPVGNLQGADFQVAISRQDTNRLFATIQYPFYSVPTTPARLFTIGAGDADWSPVATDLPTGIRVSKYLIDPTNAARQFISANNTGFGSAQSGGLYRTVDGGAHWTERGFGHVDVDDFAIDGDDPRNVYVTSALGFHISHDGGETFTRSDSFAAIWPSRGGAVALDPEIPSTVYASSGNLNPYSDGVRKSWILRSVDRGVTWEVLRNDAATPNYYVNRMVVDPSLPTQLVVNTGLHGVAAFEVRNDLAAAITGHTGDKKLGVPASYQVRITNTGPFHATRVQASLRIPPGATNVRWNQPSRGFCGRHGNRLDCEISVIPKGTTNVFALIYTPTQVGPIIARLDVDAHERDLNNANNTATATTNAVP